MGGVSAEVFTETMTNMKDLMGDNHAEAMQMVEGYGQHAAQEQRLWLARAISDEQKEYAKTAHDEREILAQGQAIILNVMLKQSAKEKQEERQKKNMQALNIASSACKKDPEPFARGATCSVYKAEWVRRNVAVKVVLLQGLPKDKREKLTENFKREVGILLRLRHPNIRTFYGVIDDDLTSLQLVMKLATRNLFDFLKQSPDVLPLSEQLNLSLQIASGMRYLHNQNVAHRDLKSPNVLICNNNECKITDFSV